MKIIKTEKYKDKLKKNKKNFKKYWKEIFPKEYVSNLSANTKSGFIKIARKLQVPLIGTVKQTYDGFVYVDISNDVIHGLFSLIDSETKEKPPYLEDDYNNVGAHISVINAKELTKEKPFQDSGTEVHFKLGKFYSVDPESWKGIKRVWFVEVESPELEEIREKYGLSKKLKGHEFHITVAVERNK